jgi:hypothetical protein
MNRTSVALDHMQPFGVRVAHEVEPRPVVESDGVDDERVAFPMPDGVTVPCRVQRIASGGVRPSMKI